MPDGDETADQWFRQHLVEATQHSTELYDKAVLALSGGALTLSMLVLDKLDQDGVKQGWCLVVAWSFWGMSLAFSLFSHWCSSQALRTAVNEFDSEPHKRHLGGWMSSITEVLNGLAGIGFLAGVFAFLWFVGRNYGGLFHG